MASAKSIQEELECPICKEEFVDPRFIGECMHRSCHGCLQQLITAGHHAISFPCPECRHQCLIPGSGFKSDFKLKSIIHRYKNAQQNTAGTGCTVCKSPASHFCRQCDELYLCPPHGKKHDLNHGTTGHNVIGICLEHGKPLTHYCRPCEKAACSACRIAYHCDDGEPHDVQLHNDVVNETIESFDGTRKCLKRKASDMDAEETRLTDIISNVNEKTDDNLKKISLKTESVLSSVDRKCQELGAKSRDLEKEANRLIEEANKLLVDRKSADLELKQLEKKSVQLRKTKTALGRRLNSQRNHVIGKIRGALEKAREEKQVISSKMAALEGERVLESSSVETLTKLHEDMKTISQKASDCGDKFVNATLEIGEFVQSGIENEIGSLSSARETVRKFSHLKTIGKPEFPEGLRCTRADGVVYMHDGHLAVYGGSYSRNISSLISPTNTLSCLWVFNPEQSQVNETLKCDNSTSLPERTRVTQSDVLVTATDSIMLLRSQNPIVSEFDTTRKVIVQSINDEKGEEETVKRFLLDEAGNFVILCGVLGTSLVIVSPEGNILRRAPLKNVSAFTIAPNGDLWAVHRYAISKSRWDGEELRQLSFSSFRNELAFMDITTNEEGEVFVLGVMKMSIQVGVLQVQEGAEGKIKLNYIRFEDRLGRICGVPMVPSQTRIAVQDTQVALVYNNTVEMFQLSE